MRSLLFGLLQLAGAACVLYAVAILAGWPWALLIGGAVLVAATTWAEASSPSTGPGSARWTRTARKDGGS